MSDLLLAQPKLDDGWIDTSVGEPNLIRNNLIKTFNLDGELNLGKLKINDLIYPSPNGYAPLVKFLENKYKAPVVITNGAKQGLGACFYALAKQGYAHFRMKSPFWALIPSLAKMHDMGALCGDPDPTSKSPYLLLDPNNPDGSSACPNQLIKLSEAYKEAGTPLLHDAAYYTHSYLSSSNFLPAIGDVQIYSISKMLGISGARLGFVVCHNPIFYKLICEYMETMTVGVSINVQAFLFDLISNQVFKNYNSAHKFEYDNYLELKRNKKICLDLDSEVLEVPSNLEDTSGMFGWFKVGPKANFDRAKINIIKGDFFGGPGMVRMNLAFDENRMKEIVSKLNDSKYE